MNEYALITGSSSGIGLALAKSFAKRNHNLILVARNKEKLEEIAQEITLKYKVDVKVISKDLSLENSAEELFEEVKAIGIYVKYLVNNAGFGQGGKFLEVDLERNLNMISLNVNATVKLTKLFGTEMVKTQGGKILNTASMAGFFPGPNMSIYFATKAFILSFTESIAAEYKNSNTTFTALCPGITESNFGANAGVENTPFWNQNKQSAEYVSEFAYKTMMKGQTIAIPGFQNKIFISISKLLPRPILANIIDRLF